MKRKRHTPEEIIKKAARSGDASGRRPERGGSLQEARSEPADISSLEGAIWRGERGDGEASQALGKGKRAAQEAGR